MWAVADGRTLEVTLAKAGGSAWWPCVVKGQPELDLQKVEPESSKLSDLGERSSGEGRRPALTLRPPHPSPCAPPRPSPPLTLHPAAPPLPSRPPSDPEMRATVEKMMYDQRQKAMGLPTSEEEARETALKRFMEAHPEMDFSQAKFT